MRSFFIAGTFFGPGARSTCVTLFYPKHTLYNKQCSRVRTAKESNFMSRFLAAAFVIFGTSIASAQRGGGDWMTSANDAQRSSWVRTDAKISKESVQKPGFELLWKAKPGNTARQLNSLTPPVLIDFYIGYKGFRALGIFG